MTKISESSAHAQATISKLTQALNDQTQSCSLSRGIEAPDLRLTNPPLIKLVQHLQAGTGFRPILRLIRPASFMQRLSRVSARQC